MLIYDCLILIISALAAMTSALNVKSVAHRKLERLKKEGVEID
jgi:hypothetical protein